MKVTQVTAPAYEPVTLANTRTHLRLTATGSPASHPDDSYIESLITAAREYAEIFTRRALITQTWDMWLDDWPADDYFELPKPPLQSITSITYKDTDGTSYSLTEGTDFVVDTDSTFGRVVLEWDESWPTTSLHPKNPIKVRFVCGYSPNSDSPPDYRANVPQMIKQAIYLVVGHLYNNREDTIAGVALQNIPTGAQSLLYPYRAFSL